MTTRKIYMFLEDTTPESRCELRFCYYFRSCPYDDYTTPALYWRSLLTWCSMTRFTNLELRFLNTKSCFIKQKHTIEALDKNKANYSIKLSTMSTFLNHNTLSFAEKHTWSHDFLSLGKHNICHTTSTTTFKSCKFGPFQLHALESQEFAHQHRSGGLVPTLFY